MSAKKKPVASDSVDIKDKLVGPISEVIANLQELAKTFPKGEIEIGTHSEYGETYDHAYLNFTRPKTALEIEIDDLNAKARKLQTMRADAAAFAANNTPYPKAKEMAALKKELGYFALAPMRGTLGIDRDKIVVWDMMRGSRLRDGTWVARIMRYFGNEKEDAKREAMLDKRDVEYIS